MVFLMLRFYSAIWWLVLPLALGRLWWRGRKEAGYRTQIGERLGFYAPVTGGSVIWVHAVSVGETRAAEPLISALLRAYPAHRIVLTHMTATGRATGAALFGSNSRVLQSYLPYDTLWMTGRFVAHFKPALCVLMETEVWPSLIASCETAGVPVALVNARLSERSLRRAQRFGHLLGTAAKQITLVAAQSQEDADRLQQLGVRQIAVTGSIKFDIEPPPAMLAAGAVLRKQIGPRPVLLSASTREGEEVLLLDAYMAATLPPELLLVIVPRHPQRFDEVARLIEARGLRMQRRSLLNGASVATDTHILLGDSMGEMFAYYAACDIAFIGGSLLPLGGQNLIEAAACGKPVLFGPHMFNFAQISEAALAAGAALRLPDARAVFVETLNLLHEAPVMQRMAQNASAFAQRDRGATLRTLVLLQTLLD
jgi:3-deoxy-D-manno-octulosonic-acid transferase